MAGTIDIVLNDATVTALESNGSVLRLKISGDSAAPGATYFTTLQIGDLEFARADATTSVDALVRTWQWDVDENPFVDASSYEVALVGGLADDDVCTSGEFEGYMAWPYLDCGTLGQEKSLEGFDIVADGAFSVSIGYDQRKGQEAAATTPYALSGDTLNGDVIPLPVSAPSLQMRISFDANQAWEWFSSNLYIE